MLERKEKLTAMRDSELICNHCRGSCLSYLGWVEPGTGELLELYGRDPEEGEPKIYCGDCNELCDVTYRPVVF